MRRLLVAGFAALAVVLGLVVSTGVASAAPSRNPDCDRFISQTGACAPDAGLNVGLNANVNVNASVAATPLPCAPVGGVRPAGCDGQHRPTGPGHPGFPGHVGNNGGHWIPGGNLPWGGPTLYGHQLWLNAQLGLDICGYGNSYDTFLNRNLSHRSDIDRYLGRGRWQSLYSSDCNSNVAVIPGGLTLINGSYLNLDLLGLQGGGLQSVCSYPDWNTFDNRLGSRFGGRWGNVRNRFGGNAFNEFRQLRVNAHCTLVTVPSSTTIVQAPQTTVEAAPADPSGNDAASAPAPVASGPLNSALPAPAVAPSNGGDSPAFVLAHARAV